MAEVKVELYTHVHFVREALEQSELMDFLSADAQLSLTRHIARVVCDGYEPAVLQYLTRTVMEALSTHALYSVLSHAWQYAVARAVNDYYVMMKEAEGVR